MKIIFKRDFSKQLLSLLMFFCPYSVISQKIIRVQSWDFEKYDKRWKTTEIKKLSMFSFGPVLTIDEKPLFGEIGMGNISKGKNYGISCEFLYGGGRYHSDKKSIKWFYYTGVNAELYPKMFHKYYVFVGYQTPFDFMFLPRLEYGIAFNMNDSRKEFQYGIVIAGLTYYSTQITFGLRSADSNKLLKSSDFDNTFYVIKLTSFINRF
jgi:hypothetical protein